jgi:hypothetical protein
MFARACLQALVVFFHLIGVDRVICSVWSCIQGLVKCVRTHLQLISSDSMTATQSLVRSCMAGVSGFMVATLV